LRIENLGNNLKQRFKNQQHEIGVPDRQLNRTEIIATPQGVTKRQEKTKLETATLWQQRHTVSGCQTLRMSIHKRIF
jgi:hypothetical protein